MNPGRIECSARDRTSGDLVPTAPRQQSNNHQHVFSGSQIPVSCCLPPSLALCFNPLYTSDAYAYAYVLSNCMHVMTNDT